MKQQRVGFRILVIDDDERMNERLSRLLSGHRVHAPMADVVPHVDALLVELEKDPTTNDRWRISTRTLDALERLSVAPPYDLVLLDYGYATDEGKRILWGKKEERGTTLPSEEIEGRLFTPLDLRRQYEQWLRAKGRDASSTRSVFRSAKRVIMRSFASREFYDVLGPVEPDRRKQTQAAFSAEVVAIDSRQEFFATDRYYAIYERDDGREFYRHLVGAFTLRTTEAEMLRKVLALASHAKDGKPLADGESSLVSDTGDAAEFDSHRFHPAVVESSRALFKDGHYAQAVFEACKALSGGVRAKSGLEIDGAALMTEAFSLKTAKLRFNAVLNQSERDEQQGFMHLFQGAMLGIRNPAAHESLQLGDGLQALEHLSLLSLLFRKLEQATK